VSHLVLAETTWVLDAVYERTAKHIAAAIDMLLNHERLTLQDADVVVAAAEQFRRRPALGFSDCLVLEMPEKLDTCPSERLIAISQDSTRWCVAIVNDATQLGRADARFRTVRFSQL